MPETGVILAAGRQIDIPINRYSVVLDSIARALDMQLGSGHMCHVGVRGRRDRRWDLPDATVFMSGIASSSIAGQLTLEAQPGHVACTNMQFLPLMEGLPPGGSGRESLHSGAPDSVADRDHELLPWAVAAMVDLSLADTTRHRTVDCFEPANAGLFRLTERPDLLLACHSSRHHREYYIYTRPATGDILAAGWEVEIPESSYAPTLESLADDIDVRLGQGEQCQTSDNKQHGRRWRLPYATVLLVVTAQESDEVVMNLEAQRGDVTCSDVIFAPGIMR
ncbi:MAG TPA: hypothetical protein VFK13_08200 [Gemmatimonadaceae bacterium]|nr:hypothetical protein [Gemmatimonadaceae bacterium]